MGFMYKNLGRMMGRSYEETVYILIKCLKNAESQMRVEIIVTLEKVVTFIKFIKCIIFITILYFFNLQLDLLWNGKCNG